MFIAIISSFIFCLKIGQIFILSYSFIIIIEGLVYSLCSFIYLPVDFFSRRRWRLYRPKSVSCCVFDEPNFLCSICMAIFHTCLAVGSILLFISFYCRAPWLVWTSDKFVYSISCWSIKEWSHLIVSRLPSK